MLTKLMFLVSVSCFFILCVRRDNLKIVPWKLVIMISMALLGLYFLTEAAYAMFVCMLLGAYTDSISETVYSSVTYVVGVYEILVLCLNYEKTHVFIMPMVLTIMCIFIWSYVFKLLGSGDADVLIVCAVLGTNIGVVPWAFVGVIYMVASCYFLISMIIKSIRRRAFQKTGAFMPSLLLAYCSIFILSVILG